MRFVDFLKATVLLSGGAATLLAAVTVASVSAEFDAGSLMEIAVGWWIVATGIGGWLGRRNMASPPIARLLADAKMQMSLPELRPRGRSVP